MLAEAAGLAVLAALSPTAVLVAAAFLGSANPRRTALFYLTGALVMTAIMAIAVFLVLRAGHVQLPQRHQVKYGVRVGLGLLLLAAAAFLHWRPRRPADPAKPGGGVVGRLLARPGGKAAFLAGIVVYSPSLTFVAAIQVVATAENGIGASIIALIVIIAVTIAFVWLPLVLYLLTPDRTGRLLAGFNAWLRAHGPLLVVLALLVAGLVVTLDGVLGLAGVTG